MRHPYLSLLGFGLQIYRMLSPSDAIVQYVFPIWFLVLLSATLAAVPWIRWRFNM